jgi:hypothetical protein
LVAEEEGMVRCIWCKRSGRPPSLEDILLAGGPAEVVFKNGEVCRPCNNGHGHLDQAVRDTLDIPAFQFGVVDRRGRPSEIRNRGNLQTYCGPDGPVIVVNMESRPMTTPDGFRIGPFRGRKRDVRASIKVNPATGEATATISGDLGDDPKFVRGIQKMAFELLAFRLGAEAVLGDEYDPVRTFVRTGVGRRYIFMRCSPDVLYGVPAYTLTGPTGGQAMHFWFLGFEFFVDLTPAQQGHANMVVKARELGLSDWGSCPPWP